MAKRKWPIMYLTESNLKICVCVLEFNQENILVGTCLNIYTRTGHVFWQISTLKIWQEAVG